MVVVVVAEGGGRRALPTLTKRRTVCVRIRWPWRSPRLRREWLQHKRGSSSDECTTLETVARARVREGVQMCTASQIEWNALPPRQQHRRVEETQEK